MAFIPVPDTVELVIVFETGAGEQSRTVLNITAPVAWTLNAMEGLAQHVVDYILGQSLDWMSGNSQINHLHVTDLSSASGPSFDWQTGTNADLPKTGATGTLPLPAQNALVTSLRSQKRGRSYRGRNYWPALDSALINNDGKTVGLLRAGHQQAFVTGLLGAFGDVGGVPVVVSRHQNKQPLTQGIVTPIITHDTNTIVDTQRRRNPNA